MKVLLIQPPVRDFYRTSIRTQPIGLAYLASSLRTHGHEVEILDCQTERKRSIPVPHELSYVKEFYPFNDRSPFKLYSGFYHFGMDWGEIRQRIEASEADAFGISSSFTPYHGEALEIARIIKEWKKGKIVIMGGSHVSSDPEGVLESLCVDYVVVGEGEVRLSLLLERIERGLQGEIRKMDGIGFRENGEIRINPPLQSIQDLDSLPPPARDLLDPDRYRTKRSRSTMLITSRGCPHQCAYCSAHLVMGSAFRTRSPEAIVEEMKDCLERYGIRAFDIEDDNFTFDQGRARRLMNLIIESFGEGSLELSAMNGVSFASLDRELLGWMKRAGFRTLNLSLVSTGRVTKERMKRPNGLIEFDPLLEEATCLGLNVIAYGIFGMPGQTTEEMVDTLIYLAGRRVLIGPSIYYPAPGTPLFERCRRENVLPPHPAQWRSSAFPIETPEFSRLDLVTLFRLTRGINFIKGKMDQGALDEGITWRELSQILKERVKAKGEVEVEAAPKTRWPMGDAPSRKQQGIRWEELLLMLINERSFFSLRKEADGGMIVIKEESSRRVLDDFFEKAWNRPILKS